MNNAILKNSAEFPNVNLEQLTLMGKEVPHDIITKIILPRLNFYEIQTFGRVNRTLNALTSTTHISALLKLKFYQDKTVNPEVCIVAAFIKFKINLFNNQDIRCIDSSYEFILDKIASMKYPGLEKQPGKMEHVRITINFNSEINAFSVGNEDRNTTCKIGTAVAWKFRTGLQS